MWWIIWAVLVIAAVVVLALILRDVWGKTKAFGRELSRAQLVADDLSAKAAELERLAAENRVVIRPRLEEDRDTLREEYRAVRDSHAPERAARQARHRAVWGRWVRDEWGGSYDGHDRTPHRTDTKDLT